MNRKAIFCQTVEELRTVQLVLFSQGFTCVCGSRTVHNTDQVPCSLVVRRDPSGKRPNRFYLVPSGYWPIRCEAVRAKKFLSGFPRERLDQLKTAEKEGEGAHEPD